MEKPGKAFTFFEKATFTSVSTDDLAYAGMALSSVKLGNLTDAKMFAEKALKENPDLVDARLALAYTMLTMVKKNYLIIILKMQFLKALILFLQLELLQL